MKFIKILLIFLLFASAPGFALEERTIVRVGISNSNFSKYEHKSASFVFDGNSTMYSMENEDLKIPIEPSSVAEFIFDDGKFTIILNDKELETKIKGAILLLSEDKIGIKNLNRKGDPAYYRGMFELKPANSEGFNIINVLDMQNYLKGVVPNEMPVSFGIEALKAQAVAARNYANRDKKVYKNYDLCDSVACQVYFGQNSETEISNEAVDETLGIYALYNDDIILTLYSSTASGITENYLDTFGEGIEDKPYLKSVKDNKGLKISDNADKIEEYFLNPPPSFDMNSPKYRWEVKFEREELEDILNKTLYEQSKSGFVEPEFGKDNKIKNLYDIKVLKRGASYKVLEVEINSASGTYTIKKELPIRRVFKKENKILSSANFIVKKNYKREVEETIDEENLETIDIELIS